MRGPTADAPLLIGSVKTNHLEIAAGVAGLVKAILMLKHARFRQSAFRHAESQY